METITSTIAIDKTTLPNYKDICPFATGNWKSIRDCVRDDRLMQYLNKEVLLLNEQYVVTQV